MALLKSKTLNGATGSYWKVTKITSDKSKMTIRCLLTFFADQAHASLIPAQSLWFAIPFDFSVNSSEINGNLFSLSYTRIKAIMNDIRTPAIAEVVADPDNNIEGSPAIPAVYVYPDLVGAVDA